MPRQFTIIVINLGLAGKLQLGNSSFRLALRYLACKHKIWRSKPTFRTSPMPLEPAMFTQRWKGRRIEKHSAFVEIGLCIQLGWDPWLALSPAWRRGWGLCRPFFFPRSPKGFVTQHKKIELRSTSRRDPLLAQGDIQQHHHHKPTDDPKGALPLQPLPVRLRDDLIGNDKQHRPRRKSHAPG